MSCWHSGGVSNEQPNTSREENQPEAHRTTQNAARGVPKNLRIVTPFTTGHCRTPSLPPSSAPSGSTRPRTSQELHGALPRLFRDSGGTLPSLPTWIWKSNLVVSMAFCGSDLDHPIVCSTGVFQRCGVSLQRYFRRICFASEEALEALRHSHLLPGSIASPVLMIPKRQNIFLRDLRDSENDDFYQTKRPPERSIFQAPRNFLNGNFSGLLL